MTVYTARQVKRALNQANVRIAGSLANDYMVYCYIHGNSRTPAAEVSKTTGMFHCFACNETRTLVELLMDSLHITYFAALRIIGDDDFNIVEELNELLAVQETTFPQSVIDKMHSQIDGRGREYLNNRMITDESIEFYELGYSVKQDMVIWPVHSPKGELWGLIGRTVAGKIFKNSTGLKKSLTLYNLHRVWTSDRIFVVESSFDAMRLGQVGVPAVATMGAGISATQISLLHKSFDDVIVIPDNDEAGRGMVTKIRETMPAVEVFKLSDDFNNMTDEQLQSELNVV